MGRYRKFTARQFSRAVNKYFEGIMRTVPLTEWVPTGEFTNKGKPIMKQERVLNDEGEEIFNREFAVPPTVSGLCLALKISGSTFESYAKTEEYAEAAEYARMIIEHYNEVQLVTRERNVEGIKFNLAHNFGWKNRVEVTQAGVEDYLRNMPEELGEF